MMAQNYKDLIAWQKAMQLVNAVCEATDTVPPARDLQRNRPDPTGSRLDP